MIYFGRQFFPGYLLTLVFCNFFSNVFCMGCAYFIGFLCNCATHGFFSINFRICIFRIAGKYDWEPGFGLTIVSPHCLDKTQITVKSLFYLFIHEDCGRSIIDNIEHFTSKESVLNIDGSSFYSSPFQGFRITETCNRKLSNDM